MSTFSVLASSRRLLAGLLAIGLFSVAPSAHAVILTVSSSFTLPTSDFGNLPNTEDNPTIGQFDFRNSPNFGTINDLGTINISLRFFGLDTLNGNDNFNAITLTLGGFDTGIVLNGYGNGTQTKSFSGTANNAASIVNAFNTNGGLLTIGLLDSNGTFSLTGGDGSNPFALVGGTASLSFVGADVTPVPFSPAETLGYSLVAFVLGARELKRRGLLKAAFAGRS